MKIGNQAIMHPVHDRIWDMLPWYHNGSLKADEHREVEAHLGECLVCGREMRRLGRLAVAVEVPAADHACTQAYMRLSERIHAREVRTQIWTRKLLGGLRDIFEPVPLIAGAAVLVVSAALAAVIVVTGDAKLSIIEQPFQTLGHQEQISAPLSHLLFRIVLADGMKAADRNAWLVRYDAELIDGPSEIGVLTIKVAMRTPGFDTALERMRADAGTIFVEPVDVIGTRPDRHR